MTPQTKTPTDGLFDRLKGLVDALGDEVAARTGSSRSDDPKIGLLRKQQRFIDAAVAQVKSRAAVLSVGEEHSAAEGRRVIVVSYMGSQLETQAPNDMDVAPGDEVSLLNATLQPVGVVKNPLGVGEIVTVTRLIDKGQSEILIRGVRRMVLNGACRDGIEVGDQVIVDPNGLIMLRNLGKGSTSFEFTGSGGVAWDDIIGCAAAKRKLRDAIELPYIRPDVFAHYHDEPPKGLALIGIPGCGKTRLLKACAASHRKLHGDNAFIILVKGAELLRGIVGETEEQIRMIFEIGRAHFRRTKVRALFMIDEAEALLRARGKGISSDVESTNVPTFLSEMNGVESDGNPVVVLATNKPELIDDAVMRDERMDEIIVVGRPTKEDAPAFFTLYFRDTPIDDELPAMAQFAADEFFASRHALATVTRRSTGAVEPFTLGHIVNGAMLAGVARRARASARNRDLATTAAGGSLGSVTRADIEAGVADALEKNRHLPYDREFLEFARGFAGDIELKPEVQTSVAS